MGRAFMVMARVHGITLQLVRELPVGRISVDILTQRARLREREVELSPTEHSLLYLLATNPGVVLDRDLILDSIWGSLPTLADTIVHAHVEQLNQKLSLDGPRMVAIEAVPPNGYRLMPEAFSALEA